MIVDAPFFQQVFAGYRFSIRFYFIFDQLKMLHKKQRGDTEVLQFAGKSVGKRRDRLKARIRVSYSKRENEASSIRSRHGFFRNVFRSCKILDLNSKCNCIAFNLAIEMGRIAEQTHRVANAKNRFKTNAEFTNLVQIVNLIRLANVTKSLKVCRCKWLAIMQYFQTVGMLNKADALCLCIFCILKQLIHKMRFVRIELYDAFQSATQHSVFILRCPDSVSDIAHD